MRNISVDLNVNGPYGLIYFKAWSSASGTLWEALGGAVFLEEVGHWKWTLKFPKPTPFPVSFLYFLPVDKNCKFSAAAPECNCLCACCYNPCLDHHGLSSRNCKSQLTLPSICCLGHAVLSKQQKCRHDIYFLKYLTVYVLETETKSTVQPSKLGNLQVSILILLDFFHSAFFFPEQK